MNAKHTQGPWKVAEEPAFSLPSQLYKKEIWRKKVAGESSLIVCSCRSFTKEGAEANARLISAAPELLEACKTLLEKNIRVAKEEFNISIEHTEWVKNARQAIAKAEGKED